MKSQVPGSVFQVAQLFLTWDLEVGIRSMEDANMLALIVCTGSASADEAGRARKLTTVADVKTSDEKYFSD